MQALVENLNKVKVSTDDRIETGKPINHIFLKLIKGGSSEQILYKARCLAVSCGDYLRGEIKIPRQIGT